MSVALLDINDCNLQLWRADSVVHSPGYALLENGAYRFGSAARGSARLRPRDINNRYWWQLSTEPLQPALGPARHSADLVHAHLQQIHDEAGRPEEMVLACSGSMERAQLSLLLGIIEQCQFAAVALVNRSALLGSLHCATGRLFHLELQLHQALLTEMTQTDNKVSVAGTMALPGCGLLQLQERLVEAAANAFIRQTRFDPRRKAATEQNLYDALPAALQALAQQPEVNIEINGYRARVSATEMASAGQGLLTAATEATGKFLTTDCLLVEPLISLLPGFRAGIARLQVTAEDALWQAAQQQQNLVSRDRPLSFITALPCLADNRTESVTAAMPEQQPAPVAGPSHLLKGAIALRLVHDMPLAPGISIVDSTQGWQLHGDAMVNGRAVNDGARLAAGDRISLPDGDVLLIEVRE